MALEKICGQVKSNYLTGKNDKPHNRYLFPAIFVPKGCIYGRDRKLIQALNTHIAHLEVIIDEQEINYRDLRAFARELQSARNRALALFDTMCKPSLVLDLHLLVVTANRAFYRLFDVIPTEIEGRSFDTLGNGQWQSPRLRACLEDVIQHDIYIRDFAVEHTFERIGQKTMLLDVRQIADFSTDRSILVEINDRQQLATTQIISTTGIENHAGAENPIKDLFLSLLSGRLHHPIGITVGWSELIRYVRLMANHDRCSDDRSSLDTTVDPKLDPMPVIEAAIANTALAATVENIQSQNPITPFSPQHIGKYTRLQQVLQHLLSNAVKFDRLDPNS